MPMNEYGEIVRPHRQSSDTSEGSSTRSTNNAPAVNSFESEVQGRFTVGKKRNFNLITLAVAVPLYAMIGYFAARYLVNGGYDIGITSSGGALICGIAAFIATLIYNNVWATKYSGSEYLVSILITGISAAIIALVIFILYLLVQLVIAVVKALSTIILIIIIVAVVAGG